MNGDPKVDAYIEKAAPFARPILEHVRALVHEMYPEVSEATKWGFPHFVYRSKNLASMAAFKAHASVNLWYADEARGEGDGMGNFGKLTGLADLPPDAELRAKIAAAAARIEDGAKPVWMAERKPRAATPVPPELEAAITANPEAARVWAGFAPSHIREYADWISEAKRDETKAQRIAQAVAWIAEGKQRNWKYQKR